MRAAVYNRFWHSMGGGERHAGMIAEVLSSAPSSRQGGTTGAEQPALEVDVIGHTEVDLGEVGEHLGLDLSRCAYRRVADRGDAHLADISADYDLWVTASYMNRLAPKSRRAAYLCYFPTPFDHDMEPWRKALTRTVGPLVRDTVAGFDYGVGWYPPEGGRRRRWTWTSGDGVLSVPPGRQRLVRADFGRPGAPGPVDLTLTDEDGQELTSFEVTPHFRAHVLNLGPAARGTELHLRSDTFTPGGSDIRELGVAMSRARLAGTRAGPRRYVALRFPWLRMDPDDLAFLTSYDVVMANSQYTRGWIRRLWDRDADVLYPPIQTARLTPAPERDRTVVTVGRFFAPGLGHAKRQLEMVRWFGDLYRSGHLPGWRMHVAGGCEASQLPYLAAVRAAAEGLPVEIHPNAPRKEVERLLSTASIFWSATGYGEDERRPWAAEHFGMTTVEAMAGGCVPVVIDRAGHREIVRAGLDGFRWRTPAELSDLTVRVARDGEERARLATAAAERARQFSDEAFATRWADIVARHHLLEE